MKNSVILLSISLIFISTLNCFSQVSISKELGQVAHESALLDLKSEDKGLLIPRVELVDISNNNNPINEPAIGLLVYNKQGALDEGFYYWNGSEWTMIGSNEGLPNCITLNEAYNCTEDGGGREIFANAGAVEITLPLGGEVEDNIALRAASNKGTLEDPTIAIRGVNTEHGAGLFAVVTNENNLYSAIEGITYSSEIGSILPTGISGYHYGTGRGVGVWGETGEDAANSSVGIYGRAKGGNSFGGYFYSNDFPGAWVTTGNEETQAMQITSYDNDPHNPAMYVIGLAEYNCGDSGGDYGNSIIFNNVGGEATLAPDHGGYGFLGTDLIPWREVNAISVNTLSKRELKRDINYFDENIYQFVMADIENIKPALYKYKTDNDRLIEGKETTTRYNKRLGLIVDDKETPDYIKNNTFSAIDIYGLATLAITGVQYNRNSIKELEEQEKKKQSSKIINDFGIASIEGNEVEVFYNKDFKGKNPIVTVTPLSPVNKYYIKEVNNNSFVLAVEDVSSFQFNWIAMAEYQTKEISLAKKTYNDIESNLKMQMHVDKQKREEIKNASMQQQRNNKRILLELKGYDKEEMPETKRVNIEK